MPEKLPATMRHRFLRFAASEADAIWHGADRAFLLAVPGGAPAIIDGRCPHRGGPLALGHYDCKTASLRCPWHGQRQTRRQLLTRAWPALRVGKYWTVVLPADDPADDGASDGNTICFRQGQLVVDDTANFSVTPREDVGS